MSQYYHKSHLPTPIHPKTRTINRFLPTVLSILTKYHCASFLLFLLVPVQDTMSLVPPAATSGIRPFALNVELNILPERRDEFMKIITYDAQQTIQTEPGSVQFTMGADTVNENKFHLHEQYRTKKDFDDHCATAHFKAWDDFCKTKPFLVDPIVQFYQCESERVNPSIDALSPIYCLNVELCIRPEVRDEFIAVIQNNQLGSRTKEPLCVQYDYGESTTTPNHFYFHEQYIGKDHGKEGFDQHAQSDHFKKWEEFVADTNPFTKEPVVSFFQSIPY
jgi:(4S)-4-hydroxy-5-phosphonooxypentane-2,3-dione isomerase